MGGASTVSNCKLRCRDCENADPHQRTGKKSGKRTRHHKKLYQPRKKYVVTKQPHRNHVQPTWHYFEDIAYYYREVRNGGLRRGLPARQDTTQETRPHSATLRPPDEIVLPPTQTERGKHSVRVRRDGRRRSPNRLPRLRK